MSTLLLLGALGGVVLYAAYKPDSKDGSHKKEKEDPREEYGYSIKKKPYGNINRLDHTLDDDFLNVVAVDQSFGPQGLPRVIVESRGGTRYVINTTLERLPTYCRHRGNGVI